MLLWGLGGAKLIVMKNFNNENKKTEKRSNLSINADSLKARVANWVRIVGITAATAALLTLNSCKQPEDDPIDPSNPPNPPNPPTDNRSAVTVQADIAKLVNTCLGTATLEECADCLAKVIEEQNKNYESEYLINIGKIGNREKVDRIQVDGTSKVKNVRITGERDIQKIMLPGATEFSGAYQHVITNKAK